MTTRAPAEVYVVERATGDGDGLYAFTDAAQAIAYGALYGADVHALPLNDERAGRALIREACADGEPA